MYTEIKGDAVEYFKQYAGSCALVHQVNAQGVMASGIAKQIKEEFPKHFKDYERLSKNLYLGRIVPTVLEHKNKPRKMVIGITGQEKYGKNGKRYTNYAALFDGLLQVLEYKDNIIVPKNIGCGLGGGDWDIVEVFLKDFAEGYECNITVVEKVQ